MRDWINLMLLSTFVVSSSCFPRPAGDYAIPDVGTGRRAQYYVLHADGTFKYGYDTGDGTSEKAVKDSSGDIDGQFSYTDPDGNVITLKYEAGLGGFVARGEHLPEPSEELAQRFLAIARSSVEPFVDPLASADPDASYNFAFEGEEHSRSETSDKDGNVQGTFSYIDEFGRTRNYKYTAGRDTGFVIEGDDIPQPVDAGQAVPSAFSSATHHGSSFRSGTQTAQGAHKFSSLTRHSANGISSPRVHSKPVRVSPSVRTGSPAEGAFVTFQRSEVPGDASYSFSYDAGDHSRQESADSDLNVEGRFSFTADDGEHRTLSYVAGSETGFQAEGDHIPVPVSVDEDFGARLSSRKSPPTHPSAVATFRKQTPSRPTSAYFPPSPPSPGASVAISLPASERRTQVGSFPAPARSESRPFEEANVRSSLSQDGSYQFEYETSSHSRSESGDSENNVRGNFAFVADDDNQHREVKYEAGSETGFVVDAAHLPVGPEVPGAPSGIPTGRLIPVEEIEFVDPLADSDSDSSYNFEFESETYSRQETADKDGNVVGTYTVVDDDGVSRTYRFQAGRKTGFITEEIAVSQGARPAQRTRAQTPSAAATRAQQRSEHGSFASSRLATQQPRPSPQLYQAPPPSTSHVASQPSKEHVTTAGANTLVKTAAQRASPPLRSSFVPSAVDEVFPGFTLHQYSQHENPDRFGYVLLFDD